MTVVECIYKIYNFVLFICRVLKPPGGGSSDIFGAANGSSNGSSNGSAASTPRGAAGNTKNHMVSNIFGAAESRNGKQRIFYRLT